MSGSTIGGVIGGAIGFVVGGPAGAQVGWVVGSAVGGYVDPTQVFGPRLQDVRGQTSSVGGAIPRAWGTAPVPGNIIWQQPGVTEHRHKDDGKGSGQEQVTYTYTRSYAIMFHLGEIAGVLQIKRNGKIVYDARDDETIEAEYVASGMFIPDVIARLKAQRAENSKWINKATIYNGTQTQNPDPTIESYEGVGNVPAYRGRAYMVVTDDETQAGEIAQYEIVISVCGEVNNVPGSAAWMLAFNAGAGVGVIKDSPDGLDWSETAYAVPLFEGGAFGPNGPGFMARNGTEVLATSASADVSAERFAFRDSNGIWHQVNMEGASSTGIKPIWTGTHWMIAQDSAAPADTQVGDGLNFTSTGFRFQSIALLNGGVLGVFATGASLGEVDCVLLNSDGSLSEVKPDLNVGFITSGLAVIDSDGINVGLAVQEDLGSGNRRVHIFSTGDAEIWDEHATPFPDFTGPLINVLKVHYATILDKWVVCARDRVAIGSLSSLVLETMTFPSEITGIDSDGSKIIICGGSGMLYSWTEADGWQPLSGGEGRGIMDVLAFGIPANAIPVPDSPGGYVGVDGVIYIPSGYSTITPCSTTTVGEIISDVCAISGLTPSEIDVSQLTTTIDGYVVAREIDAASVVESLRPVGMFDPAEWDKKFRGIKRGGTAVGSINGDDLVERDGDAFEREMVQEVELLRKVSIGYLDTQASWAPNTQAWERLVGTINARGESVVEVSAVLGADQAATIAKRKGLVSWGEPQKQKFSLPYRLAKYTPTDILNYTDADAEVSQIRLMQIDDDSGVRHTEAADNRAEAYSATATGVSPKPPTITSDSLRGPTSAVYMNLPSLRTQDNVPGVSIAAHGILEGWQGAAIMLSVDDGVSYQQITTFTEPSAMGRLTAVCTESSEPISVVMDQGVISSVTEDQIVQRHNAFSIVTDGVAELGQFQTATATGDDKYDLTNTVRGLLGTTAASHKTEESFVMVATAQFVPLDIGLAGKTLFFKAVTFGTSQDAAEAVPFIFTPLFTSVLVEAYTDDAGNVYTDDADRIYYYEAFV